LNLGENNLFEGVKEKSREAFMKFMTPTEDPVEKSRKQMADVLRNV